MFFCWKCNMDGNVCISKPIQVMMGGFPLIITADPVTSTKVAPVAATKVQPEEKLANPPLKAGLIL